MVFDDEDQVDPESSENEDMNAEEEQSGEDVNRLALKEQDSAV